MRHFIWPLILSLIALLHGCASVPDESVELSARLGKQVNRLEQSHLALLQQYFENERERVNQFFYEEYVPEFSRNYFSDPGISESLELVCAAEEPADRLRAMTILSTAAQKELAKRRQALIQPINEAERALEHAVRAEYVTAEKMNSAITGLLDSAVEAQGVGEEVLGAFGVQPDDVANAVTRIDGAVTGLLEGAQSAEEKVTEFRQKLDEIRNTGEK